MNWVPVFPDDCAVSVPALRVLSAGDLASWFMDAQEDSKTGNKQIAAFLYKLVLFINPPVYFTLNSGLKINGIHAEYC